MNKNIELPVAKSTRRLMLGKGNLSFGHALFRLRKSTQHQIWPFFFFTGTMLESHLGCWIGLMNPAASNLLGDLSFYLGMEDSGWLDYWLSPWIYIEGMDHQLGI